jgi:hypothetical protein
VAAVVGVSGEPCEPAGREGCGGEECGDGHSRHCSAIGRRHSDVVKEVSVKEVMRRFRYLPPSPTSFPLEGG